MCSFVSPYFEFFLSCLRNISSVSRSKAAVAKNVAAVTAAYWTSCEFTLLAQSGHACGYRLSREVEAIQ